MKYILIFFLFMLTLASRAQSTFEPVRSISALDSPDSTVWLDHHFAPLIADKKIIGLGEVCHGGHEPFALKAQLVHYLISQQGYRQVLMETADINLRDLNTYLTDPSSPFSSGTIDSLFAARSRIIGVRTPFDATEIKAVFSWIKVYNLTHAHDPVFVRGIDISGSNYNYMRIKYFSKAYIKQLQQRYGTGMVSIDQAEQIVRQWVHDHTDSLKMTQDPHKRSDLELDLRDFYNLIRYQREGGEKSSALMTLRDSMMAFNVVQLLQGKAILWAHDTHIANSGFQVGRFQAKMLGNFMREKFGSSYYIILTDFAHGANVAVRSGKENFTVSSFSSNKRSFAYQLAKRTGSENGWVLANELTGLDKGSGYNSIGAGGAYNFITCSPQALDLLIFVGTVHPSSL